MDINDITPVKNSKSQNILNEQFAKTKNWSQQVRPSQQKRALGETVSTFSSPKSGNFESYIYSPGKKQGSSWMNGFQGDPDEAWSPSSSESFDSVLQSISEEKQDEISSQVSSEQLEKQASVVSENQASIVSEKQASVISEVSEVSEGLQFILPTEIAFVPPRIMEKLDLKEVSMVESQDLKKFTESPKLTKPKDQPVSHQKKKPPKEQLSPGKSIYEHILAQKKPKQTLCVPVKGKKKKKPLKKSLEISRICIKKEVSETNTERDVLNCLNIDRYQNFNKAIEDEISRIQEEKSVTINQNSYIEHANQYNSIIKDLKSQIKGRVRDQSGKSEKSVMIQSGLNSKYFDTTLKNEDSMMPPETDIYYTTKDSQKPQSLQKKKSKLKVKKQSFDFQSDPIIKAKFNDQMRKFALTKECYFK